MKLYLLLGIVMAGYIVKLNAERCSDCVHLDYTMRGLRTISRSLLDSLLLDTYNLNCLQESPETQITCPQDNSGMVVKCKKTHVVVQAHGILGVEPDAEVNLLAVERRCALVDPSHGNKCISHMEDTSVSSYISKTLTHLTNTWSTVNYTGANCYFDPHYDVTTHAREEMKNVETSTQAVTKISPQAASVADNSTDLVAESNALESSLNINSTSELATNTSEPSSLTRETESVKRKELREKVRKFVHLIRNYNDATNVKLSALVVIMSFVTLYLLKTHLSC